KKLNYFIFQAEDCIRDRNVTGVQTCALPISQNPYSPGKTGQKSFCFGHRFPHRFVSVQGGRVLWLVGCSGVPVDSSGDTPWRGGPPKGTTPPCRYSFERGSAA